jgi:Domain of unknown function (DUF1844)
MNCANISRPRAIARSAAGPHADRFLGGEPQRCRTPAMSDKPFTVSDRRHFTAEGQPREEASTSEPPASEAGPARAAAGPPPKAEFLSFVMSLATQAGMFLDGHGLPEGASGDEGLAAAQSIISILEMLQDKTEGRRTSEESEALEGLLYELRMAYVAAARVTGA